MNLNKLMKQAQQMQAQMAKEAAVLSGVQQAIAEGKEVAQSEMKKITGGLGMPGLG